MQIELWNRTHRCSAGAADIGACDVLDIEERHFLDKNNKNSLGCVITMRDGEHTYDCSQTKAEVETKMAHLLGDRIETPGTIIPPDDHEFD